MTEPNIKDLLNVSNQNDETIRQKKFEEAKEKLAAMGNSSKPVGVGEDIEFDPEVDAQILEDTKPKRGRPPAKK